MRTGFPVGLLKKVWNLVVAQLMGILNVTELFALKCLLSCDRNFTSTKLKKPFTLRYKRIPNGIHQSRLLLPQDYCFTREELGSTR